MKLFLFSEKLHREMIMKNSGYIDQIMMTLEVLSDILLSYFSADVTWDQILCYAFFAHLVNDNVILHILF